MAGVGEGGEPKPQLGPTVHSPKLLDFETRPGPTIPFYTYSESCKWKAQEEHEGGEGRRQSLAGSRRPTARKLACREKNQSLMILSIHPVLRDLPNQANPPRSFLDSNPVRAGAPFASLAAGGQKGFCCEICPKSIGTTMTQREKQVRLTTESLSKLGSGESGSRAPQLFKSGNYSPASGMRIDKECQVKIQKSK